MTSDQIELFLNRMESTIPIKEALEKEGYTVDDATISIGQLAVQKGVAPSNVYSAIKKHFPMPGPDFSPALGK